jgi:hypothetical protein
MHALGGIGVADAASVGLDSFSQGAVNNANPIATSKMARQRRGLSAI